MTGCPDTELSQPVEKIRCPNWVIHLHLEFLVNYTTANYMVNHC